MRRPCYLFVKRCSQTREGYSGKIPAFSRCLCFSRPSHQASAPASDRAVYLQTRSRPAAEAFHRRSVLAEGVAIPHTLGIAQGTINLHLGAVRRLAYEAFDCGLLSPDLAAGVRGVKGVKKIGVGLGNWHTAEQSQMLSRLQQRAARKDSHRNADSRSTVTAIHVEGFSPALTVIQLLSAHAHPLC